MKTKPWGGLITSLVVVSGRQGEPASLLAGLGLADLEEFVSADGIDVYSGPGWATLTIDERHSPDPAEQAATLIGFLRPHAAVVDALRQAGESVKVDIAGVAASRTALVLPPDVLAGLADLDVPLTFTTLTETGEDEEDPLAFLGLN
ncbi:hypothetical protein ABZ990_24515 [Streptomyces sp. NPDC046203]|uniref:hypothetical protein n=1 Tax=Streptomyces sp. NPDC046203 TaxID=3154602 RepID=UPI003404838A